MGFEARLDGGDDALVSILQDFFNTSLGSRARTLVDQVREGGIANHRDMAEVINEAEQSGFNGAATWLRGVEYASSLRACARN